MNDQTTPKRTFEIEIVDGLRLIAFVADLTIENAKTLATWFEEHGHEEAVMPYNYRNTIAGDPPFADWTDEEVAAWTGDPIEVVREERSAS